jgi:hypothetical protein
MLSLAATGVASSALCSAVSTVGQVVEAISGTPCIDTSKWDARSNYVAGATAAVVGVWLAQKAYAMPAQTQRKKEVKIVMGGISALALGLAAYYTIGN